MTTTHLTRVSRGRARRIILCIAAAVGLLLVLLAGRSPSNDQRSVQAAYGRLARLDRYEFISRAEQTTHPLPTFENIGLGSETNSVLVEGLVDQRADRVELGITEQDGYLLDGMRQVEFRIEEGQISSRRPGQEWEVLDPEHALDAATTDPVAFLKAARHAQARGPEQRLGRTFQVIAFELDGRAWAELMRQHLQKEMARRGELAPGMVLQHLPYYEEMTGTGTLWINEQGLPQRLTTHVVYPPLPEESEYREVRMTTDFSDWQGGDLRAVLLNRLGQLSRSASGDAASLLPAAFLLALFLVFPLGLVRFRQHKGLYQTIIVFLVTLFVGEPLLQASPVLAASTRRAEQQAASERTQAESDKVEAAIAGIQAEWTSSFDVNQGARAAAQVPPAIPSISAPAQVGVPAQAAEDPGGDPDQDGLDNRSEAALGLDLNDADSDGDKLSDGFEAAGIEVARKSWYLDPRNADTNGDEIPDTLECAQAVDIDDRGARDSSIAPTSAGCPDTDRDGTPDFADDDDDGDSVKDWMDSQRTARFGTAESPVPQQTFTYGVEHYKANTPLRVTFELRPSNPQHLWYTLNVLDWPSGDYQGQITRVHDTTLGETEQQKNGDMQLVPVVEITLPAAEAGHLPTLPGAQPVVGGNDPDQLDNWLDMEVLQRYQMMVQWSPDNRSLLIYVPATLIRDRQGNAPANFVANVLYRPRGAGLFDPTNGNAGNHAARLAWMVMMSVDECTPPAPERDRSVCNPASSLYDEGRHWITTPKKLVHRYYDDFYVTGFSVEQDLDVNGQLFYENPDTVTDTAAYVPERLFGLGTMMESYLRLKDIRSPEQALARYEQDTGRADGAVRLEAGQPVTDTDAYGLLSRMATSEAPAILDAHFAPGANEATPKLPYAFLLYVTWGRSTVAALNSPQEATANGGLRLDMSTAPDDGWFTLASDKGSTAIRIGTFTYNPNPGTVETLRNPKWDRVDPGDAWLNYLQGQSLTAYNQLLPRLQAANQGSRELFTSLDFQQGTLGAYWNLARGITYNSDLTKFDPESLTSASGALSNFREAFDQGGNNIVGALVTLILDYQKATKALQQPAAQAATVKAVAQNVKAASQAATSAPSTTASVPGATGTSGGARVSVAFGGATIGLAGLFVIGTVLVILQDQLGLGAGAVRALEGVNALIGTTLATAQFVAEVVKVSQAARAAGGLSQIRMVSTFGRVGAVAALVVVALIVVTTVVMMILNWDNAVAVKTAFVQGTVTALIVVALFMIGLNFPIGTVVALLIALIDAVITLACKIGNWTGGTDEAGQTFEARNELLCGAIVNTVVNYVGGIFYRTQQIVDMAHPNRLQFGETRTRIIEQGNRPGLVGGNRLQITQPFTVTVRIPEDIDPVRDSDGEISAFDLGLNDMSVAVYDDLIKGRHVFNYETIASRDAALDKELAWTASYSWKKFPASRADWRDWLYRDLEKSWDEELVAGINWHPPDVFLREYYKFYFAECGLFSVMIEIGCDYKSYQFTEFISGTQVIDLSEVLVYDVFPPTLSDFYTLEPLQVNGQTTNQYRLAWGGALPFPALADADGDGLRYASDPDDSRADTDGDGLPDAYEKQNGNLDASIPDIDGDGLTDYDEIRRGTRPDHADSDGDGLTDAREIEGWRFTYYDGGDTRRTVAVRSDPLLYDSDGDGHSDEDESIMGLNPHVHDGTVSALRLTTRTNDQDGYLTINQSIAFASTITNTLPERFAYGLLEAELLPTGQRFDPVPFALKPGAHRTLNGTIRTPSSAGDDDTTLTLRTRAGANILEPGKDYAQALQGLPPPDTLEFQLNFEQVPSDERNFSDVTGNATITCEAASCPTVLRLPGGNSHSYASFEGQQRYRVASRQEIKAAGFSIGGWITPQDMFGTHVNERVILGPDPNGSARLGVQLSLAELQSGVPKAKVRVTGENGSVCERTFPELSVPFSQRTHVFVTVDGNTLRGYRNGREAGSFVCNVVPTGRELQIGAGDPAVVVTVERIDWTSGLEHADGNDSVELYLQWNDERNPFFSRDIDNGDDYTSINYTRRLDTVGTSNTIHICDSDEGDYRGKCESDGDNGDDKLGEVTFTADLNTGIKRSFSSDEGHFGDDVEGRLDIGVGNTFFNGSLDDLRIYSSSLSAEEVAGLAASAHLYYQLDEAAGQKQFRNAGLDVAQLECLASDNCPASGLPGYVGQAVRFSGNTREALRVRALGERFGSDFGLGFWLKPGTGRASAAPLPLLDYGIGLEGFTLWATQGVSQTILHAAFKNDTSEPAAPAATLPAAQWSHVAVVQQADRLYLSVNGEQQQMVVFDPARGGGYRLTAADQDTLVLGNGINALLDEVQVRPSVEPRETTREIYEGSALLHLALDETPGSTRFASSTGRGELTCPTPTACPTAGVEGQVREGLEFDYRLEPASENAPHVGLPTALPLDTPFALSFWTRLPSAPTADMTLVALHSSQRNNDVSWRFELAPVGERTVPQLDFRVSGAQCGDNFAVEAPNDVALPLNQWLHLVLAYSPASSSARPRLTLFLNGRPLVQKELDQYVCTQGDVLRLGENFAGKLDEIYFYDRTLPESEILSLYHYQNTWYEDVSRQEFHFLIDTTRPVVELTAAEFVAPGTRVFEIVASDAKSGIRSVEYRDADGSWKAITQTVQSQNWQFSRVLRATTTLEARATDNLGNRQTARKQVRVDASPPAVTLNPVPRGRTLEASGTVSDTESGVASLLIEFRPLAASPPSPASRGQSRAPLGPPEAVPVGADGRWRLTRRVPENFHGDFKIVAVATDNAGNRSVREVGTVPVDREGPSLTIIERNQNPARGPQSMLGGGFNVAQNGNSGEPPFRAGLGENLPFFRGTVTDDGGSELRKVEVGLLHRQDKDDPTKVQWLDATLTNPNSTSTNWEVRLPENLEGIYDVSLRATDALDNERVEGGIWTGIIDTMAPRMTITRTGNIDSCTYVDLNLTTHGLGCVYDWDLNNGIEGVRAQFLDGALPQANLTWETQWYRDLFIGTDPVDRLYAFHAAFAERGAVWRAEDRYGNFSWCLGDSDDANMMCGTDSNPAQPQQGSPRSSAGVAAPLAQGPRGQDVLSATVSYERPIAYQPGTVPAPGSRATWEEIGESYVLVDDAVLASTRPLAETFSEARTRIAWDAYDGASHYFVGWTGSDVADPSELTRYDAAGEHRQRLPDQGRYYAHVMAMDGEDELRTFTRGPIYFDGAPPPTYLNWDEFGEAQPYSLWEQALSRTGQQCNLLGADNRAHLLSNGASARSGEQRVFGTWNDQWLALHWAGLDLGSTGDIHLYLDSREGGGIYAYDPYEPAAGATTLVTMPERRQGEGEAGERMRADFALFVEDASTIRLLEWNGNGWQEIATDPIRFSVLDDTVYIWLPLALLGVEPATLDVSLVGFVTEENSMALWATMPGDSPLNSPEMAPTHLTAPSLVARSLLTLQSAMRLSNDPAVNTTLDNCPTSLHLDRSLLDVALYADPESEAFDVALFEGMRAAVPDDIEPVLGSLCSEVADPAPGTVCELAQQVADDAGGDGPEPGPTGAIHAVVGPGDEILYHTTVRNLSSEPTGDVSLMVEGPSLPDGGYDLSVGTLAPFESRAITFTERIDPNASYDLTGVQVTPLERKVNSEDGSTVDYAHTFEAQASIHHIDRGAPSGAELDARLLGTLIGAGEHVLQGIVYDQSPLAEVELATSLGDRFTCDDTLQRDAFTSAWSCAITIPAETPDGTRVEVTLSATDVYGQSNDTIASWTFEVDTERPRLTLLDASGIEQDSIDGTILVSDTLRLSGFAGDERLLAEVEVCEELDGWRSCQDAALYHHPEMSSTIAVSDTVNWVLEHPVPQGIEGEAVPISVTAYDAMGNSTEIRFEASIDTRGPQVALDRAPSEQIYYRNTFSLSGSVSDLSDVSELRLLVWEPLGNVRYYPITLDSPDAQSSSWTFASDPRYVQFAEHGIYRYEIQAIDRLGNMWASEPYQLSVRDPY